MESAPLFDVRSPGEYQSGHIPGALSLPLFSDEERAEVGTLYKQEGPRPAFLRGLEIIGPKMRPMVEEVLEKAPEGKVLVHCWRGGNRSGATGRLLAMAGLQVGVLDGGYKAYRRYAHQQMVQQLPPLLILAGPTGSGKTPILKELQKQGEQIIDLEGLAHHKGSAFGWIEEAPQETNEQFENNIFEVYRKLDSSRPVWLEDESRGIGLNFIPESLWGRMKVAPRIYLELPQQVRQEYLIKTYGEYPLSDLRASFERIRKRLGGQHLKRALQAIEERDAETAVRIALRYYDKAYRHSLGRREEAEVHTLPFAGLDPAHIAKALREYATELFSQQKLTSNP